LSGATVVRKRNWEERGRWGNLKVRIHYDIRLSNGNILHITDLADEEESDGMMDHGEE